MIKIYVREGCPFCAMVLAKVDELNIDIEEKNIANEENRQELIALGGKQQVPYLVDDDLKEHLYESIDIVEYLHEKYGKGAVMDSKDTALPPGGVCPI